MSIATIRSSRALPDLVPIPHYSTLSRRSERIEVLLENINWNQPIHVLIDASGLKVLGEGGWGDVERNRNIFENHLLGKKTLEIDIRILQEGLVETAFFRYKTQIGPSLHSRKLKRQITEARIGAKIRSKMTHLGMLDSYKT